MKKCCFDARLPEQLNDPILSPAEFGIAPIDTLWPNGVTLRVRFMEGTPEQHAMVEQFASKWSEFANLRFEFNNASDAEIRITFDPNGGAWSMVGTTALRVRRNEPTMNLGWLDEAVILHEFGHAIGLGHEHQNPDGGIQWNKQRVYDELAGAPNFWDPATVDHNIFGRYEEDQIHGTELDPASIMMYPIPNAWTQNDFEVGFNPTLSEIDKEFIAQLYPKDGGTTRTELPINEIVKEEARIGVAGEEDAYQFTIEKQGYYTIQTQGMTDIFMSLYGPDSPTQLVAEDDDSGEGRNASITRILQPGTYFAQIRHYNTAAGTGKYVVYVLKETEFLG